MGIFNWVLKGVGIEKQPENDRRSVANVASAAVDMETEQNNLYQNPNLKTEQKFDMRNFTSPTLFNEGQQNYTQNYGVSGLGKNLVVTSPNSYTDIQMLIESLQKGQPCIINLEGLDSTDAQRKLDFLAGAIYSMGGSIKTLQPNMYILTPNGMGISNTAGGGQNFNPQFNNNQPNYQSNYGDQTNNNSGGFGGNNNRF